MKTITIKLSKAGLNVGPFNITTEFGDVIAVDVSKKTLVKGVSYSVEDNVEMLTLESTGKCAFKQTFSFTTFNILEYNATSFVLEQNSCLWRHLTDIFHYNYFYEKIEPYIIEYPFSYQYQDELLQNVKDYTKAYEYRKESFGIFNDNVKIELDNKWFNKAVLYNGQQSSGVLELVSRPLNNLQAYGQYPKYKAFSKEITYSKSDNFYQYNTFWSLQKSSQIPMFLSSCESLSIDKVVNQDNMDYSSRSFNKAPLRAKDLRIRHILDNSATTHLVSQFIVAPSQKSYK